MSHWARPTPNRRLDHAILLRVDGWPAVEERLYTSWEQATYLSPPCRVCGAALIASWINSGDADRPGRTFRLTYVFCGNGCEDR